MPDGSVQAISTSAATILSLGLAFLGLWAWGPQSDRPWEWKDLLVLLPTLGSCVCLGLVPWMALQPAGIADALKLYSFGAPLLFIAVVAAFGISWTHSSTAAVPSTLETVIEGAISKPIKTALAAAIKKAVKEMSKEIDDAAKAAIVKAIPAAASEKHE